MNNMKYFLLDTLSRLGTSILAGTLVSCLILGQVERLHAVLLLGGALMAGFGYPALGRER